MTAAALNLDLNTDSILTAFVGVVGRVCRDVSFVVDPRGRLVVDDIGDSFTPRPGEAVNAFICRVIRESALCVGDTLEAVVSNGVVTSISVQHRRDGVEVELDARQFSNIRSLLLFVLEFGYGRLTMTVDGPVLRVSSQDITLRVGPDEPLMVFVQRIQKVGGYRAGDRMIFSSDKKGRMSTVRVKRH